MQMSKSYIFGFIFVLIKFVDSSRVQLAGVQLLPYFFVPTSQVASQHTEHMQEASTLAHVNFDL